MGSLHKYEAGFFPGTGSASDIGLGKGRGFSVNLPLSEGLTDSMFIRIFSSVFQPLRDAFRPDVVVIQCGADCLAQDPMGGFSLTLEGPTEAVMEVKRTGLPILLLGGGGYHPENAARLWTNVTAAVVGMELDTDIPDTDPFFSRYGPDFTLTVDSGCRKNKNMEQYVTNLISNAKSQIQALGSGQCIAPSAC